MKPLKRRYLFQTFEPLVPGNRATVTWAKINFVSLNTVLPLPRAYD